jgi:hypothetical protein
LKNNIYSKIFVLSFITLIFSSLTLPIIKYLFDIIRKIIFIYRYQFFYQFHISFHISIFEEILLYLILGFLIFQIIICPCLVRVHFSKSFKRFIYNHLLKKKFDHFELNIIKNENRKKRFKEGKETNQINNIHLTPKIGKVRSYFYQKRITANELYPKYSISNYLRKFSNIFKSFLSFFSNFFSNICKFWGGK